MYILQKKFSLATWAGKALLPLLAAFVTLPGAGAQTASSITILSQTVGGKAWSTSRQDNKGKITTLAHYQLYNSGGQNQTGTNSSFQTAKNKVTGNKGNFSGSFDEQKKYAYEESDLKNNPDNVTNEYALQLLRYKLQVPSDPNLVAVWDVIFHPGEHSSYLRDLSGTPIHTIKQWATKGATLSDPYTIDPTSNSTEGWYEVVPIVFKVTVASILNKKFIINVPTIGSYTSGTLDLIFKEIGSHTQQVIIKTLSNQASGQIVINLDDILDTDKLTPLDSLNGHIYDRVVARWRSGPIDVTTEDKPLDVASVEVLAKRIISNYFSPTWGGIWGGKPVQKGVYATGHFPKGLYNATVMTVFLDALDPQNEGLAMNGNTVLRDKDHAPQQGFNAVTYINGGTAYIEFPDKDQQNTASDSTIKFLRSTSVAVRNNADRLSYKTGDQVYIPSFELELWMIMEI